MEVYLVRRYCWAIIFLGICCILAVSGCGGGGQKKPVPSPTKIAVSLADLNRDGNKTIQKVMKERQKKEQLDITFMDAKNDPAEQEKHIDKMIQEKVKAAVIQFIDPLAAPRLVQKLKKENIKVVCLENLPINTPVDGFIASDHGRSGELQVRFIQEAMKMAAMGAGGQQGQQGGGQQQQQGGGQQGQQQGQQSQQQPFQVTQAVDPAVAFQLPQTRPLNVLVLQGDKRDQMAREITAQNIEGIEADPNLKLLKVQDHPRWDPSLATATLSELKAAGQQPDVVLANDSALAMAAVEFFKQAGMDKRIITVGVGADEKSSMAIVAGEHEAEIDPEPEMLANYALDAASDLAQKGSWEYSRKVYNGDYDIPAKIVPVRLIGKNNIYLLQERWKKIEKQMKKQQQQQAGGGQQGQQGGGQQQQQQQGSSQQGQKQGSQQGGQQGQQGQQGQGGTTLKITTEEGKTMEVKIDGSIKKIESSQEGGKQQGGKQQGGQGGGGGS